MNKVISCCGAVCSGCPFYRKECRGCSEIKGKVYWLQYTGENVCGIYDCCVNQKQLKHCGKCANLPCSLFRDDPSKTPEENAEDHRKQLEQLKHMDDE